jgi:hypothetical protein
VRVSDARVRDAGEDPASKQQPQAAAGCSQPARCTQSCRDRTVPHGAGGVWRLSSPKPPSLALMRVRIGSICSTLPCRWAHAGVKGAPPPRQLTLPGHVHRCQLAEPESA